MPGKLALIDFDKCDPKLCEAGVCTAAEACKRKLLQQESPYETPIPDPFLCKGCGDCARACPAGAVIIGRG
ncbi:4Fe-4S binding protein [Chloroflexota bacterium]